jgi:hypothetical protein
VKIILLPMEAATADPSVDAIDVDLTAPTAPTASTATTADITKLKTRMKKELTAAEREVQNQKRRAH